MTDEVCPSCAAPRRGPARFCGQCGKAIDAASPAALSGPSPLGRTAFDPSPPVTPVGGAAAPRPPADEALTATLHAPEAVATATRSSALPTARVEPPALGGAAHPAAMTMIGRAVAPAPAHVAPTHAAPAHATPAHAAAQKPPAPLPLPSHQGTMIGVALPGIAPTGVGQGAGAGASATANAAHPSRAAETPAPSPLDTGSGWRPPPVVPAPPPLVEEPLPAAPRVREKRGVPALALVGLLFFVVAVAGAVGATYALRASDVLSAQPRLDESGKESLALRCPSCPDGTIVLLGASTAEVKAGAALLALPAPLAIGENQLTVRIDRPGAGRDEDVSVHVPIAYRVRADLASLAARPPAITVRVEAVSGTRVEVDGKPLALDAAGSGAYRIDLGNETDGPSDEQRTFERKIPFSIAPKGAAPDVGELRARAGIVPLHLDAPGLSLVTDRPTAPVSGQTRPGASLTVDGAAVTVDETGRFGVRIELPAAGEKSIEVVASSPPLAPRFVRAKIVRVASLEAAARDLVAEGPATFDGFATASGKKVVVEGAVVEARVAQGHSILLVDEKKTCPKGASCLVRVDHGEETRAGRGDTVRAFGRLAGSVPWSGRSVPNVEAALVLVVRTATAHGGAR